MESKIDNLWKMLKWAGYVLFALIFVLVFLKLYLPDKISLVNFLSEGSDQAGFSEESLRIITPEKLSVLEPTHADPASRQRLVNVFESLVELDSNMKPTSALALSWGILNENTWQFKLRPNVYFHDGSSFEVEDVVASLKRAKEFEYSQLKDLLSNIDRIEVDDNLNFKIKTLSPDPLLLQKISQVLIFPSEALQLEDDEDFLTIGTGPYVLKQYNAEKFEAERFDDYWGKKPYFRGLEIITKISKQERLDTFISGGGILTFVPPEKISDLRVKGFRVFSLPSLEVQFLVFNLDREFFAELSMRQAFMQAVDREKIISQLGGNVLAVNQFVSSGVFGFNPRLDGFNFDQIPLKKGSTILVHLPKGLSILGEEIRKQMHGFGMNVVVSYLEPEDFLLSINEKKADLYFLAFKSELGDSMDFLKTIAHSEGEYNIGGFRNDTLDLLIESAETDMDEFSRRDSLQKAMEIVVEREILGLPLFEYERTFAISKNLDFEPRIDGLVYAKNVKENK